VSDSEEEASQRPGCPPPSYRSGVGWEQPSRPYAGLTYIYYDLGLPEAAKLVGAQASSAPRKFATGVSRTNRLSRKKPPRRARRERPKKEKEEAKEEGAKSDEGAVARATQRK